MGANELEKASVSSDRYHIRVVVGLGCLVGLVLVFLFQRIDVASVWGISVPVTKFLINRSIRFLLNDLLAIGLLFALFRERKYILFALVVQAIGMILFLVPYFIFKIYYPSYNGPLISFLHRLILNPTLLLLLIPAFYFQKRLARQRSAENDGIFKV